MANGPRNEAHLAARQAYLGLGLGKISVFLLCFGFLAYFNSIPHPFVHDDVVFIQNNPRIGEWENLSEIFLKPAPLTQKPLLANTYYRPLLEVLYKIEYMIFGLNPHGYHLLNVLLHIGNSILVYHLLVLISQKRALSFWTAFLFLIHPAQTEAVASIAGVSNLLFSLFCLASFIFYVAGAQARGREGLFLYLFSLIFFAAALFTKEQAVILPLLFGMYEVLGRRRREISEGDREARGSGAPPLLSCDSKTWGRPRALLFLRVWGALVVVLGYFYFRNLILGSAIGSLGSGVELTLRVQQIPTVLLTYLKILLFPGDLHYYRSTDILKPFMLSFLVFIFLSALFVAVLRSMPSDKRRLAIWAGSWFLIGLLPVLNIIPLINESSLILTAEHFLYFPSIGFLVLALLSGETLSQRLFSQNDRRVNMGFLSMVSIVFVFLTMKQNTYWRGEVPLFERVVRFEKDFARGHILLGRAYYSHKELERAVREYKMALEIMQRYLKQTGPEAKSFYLGFIKGIHFDLAHCYEDQGNRLKAAKEYQQALLIDPQDSVLYNNLGVNELYLNNFEEAFRYFEKAMALNPNDLMARNNLAVSQIHRGNHSQARVLLEEILQDDPHFLPARDNLEKLQRGP